MPERDHLIGELDQWPPAAGMECRFAADPPGGKAGRTHPSQPVTALIRIHFARFIQGGAMRKIRASKLSTSCLLMFASIVWTAGAAWAGQVAESPKKPDVIYVPTPPAVVDAMLKLAKVGADDVVYDLGCGDGRIVIAAAKNYGARGVGIDVDPERIGEAEENARKEGVEDRVHFEQADLFETPIGEATVVTLYLLPSLNLKLRPKLWKELKIGTRVVSHAFDMDGWEPEQRIEVDGRKVFLWTITTDTKRRLESEP